MGGVWTPLPPNAIVLGCRRDEVVEDGLGSVDRFRVDRRADRPVGTSAPERAVFVSRSVSINFVRPNGGGARTAFRNRHGTSDHVNYRGRK